MDRDICLVQLAPLQSSKIHVDTHTQMDMEAIDQKGQPLKLPLRVLDPPKADDEVILFVFGGAAFEFGANDHLTFFSTWEINCHRSGELIVVQ